MKKILIALTIVAGLFCMKADAQYVRERPSVRVGISVGRPPYAGAIWVGPEYEWRGGNYVEVPGYWARPERHGAWIPGHWKYGRRGYRWIPGHWRR
jgi:hypothetical protein